MRLLSRHRPRLSALLPLLLGLLALVPGPLPVQSAGEDKEADRLELKKGDRIAILGNTLADRMQHDGWLETYLHSRFPEHDLTCRNLGFAGDELNTRLRSANFGTPDYWLRFVKADVVFAFFGYNESFAGKDGLEKFNKDLADFIKNTLAQKYNGSSAPRLVLFSPIAHEDLHDPNLPDGKENNARLEMYTDAMAQVARANKVPVVDLFRPSRDLYKKAAKPLTINGVHLTSQGYEEIAKVIDSALFKGAPAGKRDAKSLEKLRQTVAERNFYWFERYRTVDGFSIYGGRADEPKLGQRNREVMAREMEVLDIMTANRDKVVWAAARGREEKPDDSNTPPFIPVKTNKPGPLPGGKYPFLDPEKAIDKMTVARGMKVNLFASEKEFPELANPVQMSWDPKGRLWVAVWPTYPHWRPKEEMNDKILILEDTDGDGKADKCTVFADGLHCPTGFEFYDGGVLVAQAPDLMFLKDSKGGDRADVRKRVLHGLDSADTHHTANSFVLDPGGAVYFQEGTFHHTQVETPYAPTTRCVNAGVYRYEPRTQKFDVYVSFGFANPHGHVFDRWGQDIVIDGTGAVPYHAALFSGHIDFPAKHRQPPPVYPPRTRPCPGMEILSSKHFPQASQGNLLVPNVIGFQGILQYQLHDDGSSFSATEVEPILSSTDPNFRPSDVKVGPDGAIYFLDWHNPLIGHLQHNLRDPNRDRTHGRIYRVSCPGRELSKSPKISGEPINKLLELFREPEDRVRYRARIELGARPTKEVMEALKKWVAALEGKAGQEHLLLQALWLHQAHNVVDVPLLEKVLAAKDFRARAAATRVLCYWRDRVPGALERVKKMAGDEHPRVRLEAVRAASFFNEPEALEVIPISAEKGTDRYIEFVQGETKRQLEPIVNKAVASGKKIKFTTPAGQRYLLRTVSTGDLLKMERTQGVYLELLFRKGVLDEYRREALAGLAKLEKKGELAVLIDAVRAHDVQEASADESTAFDLVRLLTNRPVADLKKAHEELVRLALDSRQPVTRQLGFVALFAAEGGPAGVESVWALGSKSARSLEDMVRAVPLVRDPGQRAALFPKVVALLDGLPKELAPAGAGKTVLGRYVRIEIPGRRKTLTLAEVEVYSGGTNVAQRGKATQKNTAHGGEASRAIDGNKSGSYGGGGQTHTQENTDDPWWQVDLGSEQPIERVVVYNRTDGDLGQRLKGFTLLIKDAEGKVVYRKDKNPAPAVKAEFAVSEASPQRNIRRAAMQALPAMRGQESEAVKALARFIKEDDRQVAIQALQRIPTRLWPAEQVKPVLAELTAYVRKVPVKERTSPVVLDALQLADSLAGLLPAADARGVRKELGDLGVRVVRVGTVVEQMIFDRERLVMQAGKPVEIFFENTDVMPHNLVFLKPGGLEEVGELGEKTAQLPGALERGYVPVSDKILLASNLVQPRQSQRLSWTAPVKPGVYPYVCTYPGHWRRMHGALYVVADLDAYQADPEGYLSKNPLPIADELLKFNRPRKEWKLEDLAPGTKGLAGRSYVQGKQMFKVASCISCHKMEGQGQEFGPDLTKLDPKWTPTDVLQHVLEPSLKIDDKYKMYTFELESGKVVNGMIVKAGDKEVEIIENPLASTKPMVLKKGDIASQTASKTSLMPRGLLDKLTREEVLDLLGYVVAGGDPKNKVFQGGHDHGHGHGEKEGHKH